MVGVADTGRLGRHAAGIQLSPDVLHALEEAEAGEDELAGGVAALEGLASELDGLSRTVGNRRRDALPSHEGSLSTGQRSRQTKWSPADRWPRHVQEPISFAHSCPDRSLAAIGNLPRLGRMIAAADPIPASGRTPHETRSKTIRDRLAS